MAEDNYRVTGVIRPIGKPYLPQGQEHTATLLQALTHRAKIGKEKDSVFDRKQNLLELLGGFEPPTSSLPSDKMLSRRCGTRGCGRFCRKKDEVGNSLLHVFRPLVSPCGSRCGSEPPASSVWVNFWRGENRFILRCCRQ